MTSYGRSEVPKSCPSCDGYEALDTFTYVQPSYVN